MGRRLCKGLGLAWLCAAAAARAEDPPAPLTLWYNGQPLDTGNPSKRDAGTRFDATIGGTNSIYFLRPGFTLATNAGAARQSIDASVSDSAACPARPFTPLGTWSITFP